jgi:4-hydroxy-tetrahydrodipicolinate reductase
MATTQPITVAITGASGRMGTRLIALAHQDPHLRVIAALERDDHPTLGQSVNGVEISSALAATPNVLVDFTSPESMRHWLALAQQRNFAMLIGTTGLAADDHQAIDVAAKQVPILQAPNMSVGVNVLFKIAAEVARTLGAEYDIEIVEAHHRFKKDAPSGTACGLADAIKSATPRDIPTHSLRIGDEIGRHTAYFAALGERVELTHVATNRDTFALGALRAAKWLAQQKPGRYTMNDVLGLK